VQKEEETRRGEANAWVASPDKIVHTDAGGIGKS